MTNDISFDISNDIIEVEVQPKLTYSPPTVSFTGKFGKIDLQMSHEHMAETAFALQQYLDSIRYHDEPDAQQILNHEHDEQIELEAAS